VTLERTFFKCLHELQRLQASRRGEFVPIPEAVDVAITSINQKDAGGLALNGQTTGHAATLINGTLDHAKPQ
jgi:hypothetical protein